MYELFLSFYVIYIFLTVYLPFTLSLSLSLSLTLPLSLSLSLSLSLWQLFTYSSMSPVSAMSGVISPTSMSLFTSPGSTPRSTPRSTPPAVPRWNTPFISLDENMDYTTMSTLMPTLPADAASAQLIEDGECWLT